MNDLVGQNVGRYHILEQLGEGGMATVYKAYDTRLERDVAVKVIRTGAFPPEQMDRILKRFEREAKSLARLSHPNIVGVIDYGDHNGAPYLVMEYLPGATLKQKLGEPVPWREAVNLVLPVARALKFAHDQGIIHRDVKPANILTTLSGEPMLTDFGIAKILEETEGQTLTGAGVGVGTPEYMAPEQWTGQAGKQADIYSLGIVLYELVTGHKPYTADTPAAVLLKQASESLTRPREYVPSMPVLVENLLFKALAKKPENRYADMGAFAKALDDLLAGGTVDAPGSPVGKEALTSDELFPETESAAPVSTGGQKGIKRKRWLIPVLILGFVLVCISACLVMWGAHICPPQGPWPQPPWCPGSTIEWPFNDPIPPDPLSPDSVLDQTPNCGGEGSSPANEAIASYEDILSARVTCYGETVQLVMTLRDIPEEMSFNKPETCENCLENEWSLGVDMDGDISTGGNGTQGNVGGLEYVLFSGNFKTASPFTTSIEYAVYVAVTEVEGNQTFTTGDPGQISVDYRENKITLVGKFPSPVTERARFTVWTINDILILP